MGAGVFAGCGAGLGIIAPVALHAIPILGQLAASLSLGVGKVDIATGGLGSRASHAAAILGARVGVRHLGAGAGCGVMLGYGWGFGLMVQPTALQQCQQALQAAAQRVAARLPPPARQLVETHAPHLGQRWNQRRRQEGPPDRRQGRLSAVCWKGVALEMCGSKNMVTHSADAACHAADHDGEPAAGPLAAQPDEDWGAQQRQDLDDLRRLVLSQQNEINDLRQRLDSLTTSKM